MRREYIAWFDMPNSGKLHGQSVMPKQELIRCKDCIFWEHAFDNWGKCYGIMAGLGTYESGFCAWAERKEE